MNSTVDRLPHRIYERVNGLSFISANSPLLVELRRPLRGKSETGVSEAKRVLAAENTVLQEIAVQALSRSKNPAAFKLIGSCAEEQIKKGGFPSAALMALVSSQDDRADLVYLGLKNKLIAAGHIEEDFDSREFIRRHPRP